MATRMLPNAVHFKEFQNDPVTGVHYTATCGETALATALVCASPQIESTQEAIDLMTSMTREMMSLGWAGKPNAETTTTRLRDEAHRRGFTTDDAHFIGYQEPLDMNALHTLLLAEAGIRPIVLEVARAGQLNSYNGGSDESGVQYHFICVVGIDPDGYWCNDGDNSAITDHLVLYPWSELQQAVPCGVLVVNMQEANTMIDITAVKDYFTASADGLTWTCKNGHTLHGGILTFWRSQSNPLGFPGLPVSEEVQKFPGDANADKAKVVVQEFERAEAAYDPKRLMDSPLNVTGACYFAHISALGTKSVYDVALVKQLADANALIQKLEDELKQPAPAVLTPQQKDVMSAFASLVKAMQEGSAA